MSRRSVHLADLTFEEAREVVETKRAVALLPTGATEAHGPHLPLATDVIISGAGAERAARALCEEGTPALVLPPVAYAVTEFAAGFSGTLSIGIDTQRALVRDVILAATKAGFVGVVICNAHLEPDNIRALYGAMKDAREAGAKVAFPDVTRKPHALTLGDEFKSGACHAGSYETSLVLAAQPFLVRGEIAHTLEPNPSSLSVAIREGKTNFQEAGGPRAYFGYPADASSAEGETLYAAHVAMYVAAAKELGGDEVRSS